MVGTIVLRISVWKSNLTSKRSMQHVVGDLNRKIWMVFYEEYITSICMYKEFQGKVGTNGHET
jgi:hypothetical protein